MRDRMPESGSPSAADCWRLEARPGAVSAHAWPAFTPVPWHWLLAPTSEDIARVSLQLGAARLRSLPQALFQEAQPTAPSGDEPRGRGGGHQLDVPLCAVSTASSSRSARHTVTATPTLPSLRLFIEVV